MTAEPDFLSQTDEPTTWEERRAWWRERAEEAKAQGATHARFSCHPQNHRIILFEAWKVRPDDEGEPRFQLEGARP